MKTDKNQIIESLYKMMCSSTSTTGDSRVENNDYFKRRVLGFKAEMEFEHFVKNYPNLKYLEGGQFISKKLSGDVADKNSFVYTTISFDEEGDYLDVYKKISEWKEVKELIYIKIIDTEWSTEEFETKESSTSERKTDKILKPTYFFYSFDKTTKQFVKEKSGSFDLVLRHFLISERSPSIFPLRKREQFDYFNEYEIKILKKIYANRYFLDVIMRKAQGRQIIDLDGFIESNNKITLIEIKEKSPIKDEDGNNQKEWKYGWDSRRILWYLYLNNNINIPILYNVHQINNRSERIFVQWDSIFLNDFLKGTSWSSSRGGGGGEDTLLAPFLLFSNLNDILNKIISEK